MPLSDAGIAQARRLAGVGVPDRCYCSPMLRTRQTADTMGLTYETDANLREISFGRWEGLAFDEINASDPELVDRWAEYADDFAFPEGESVGGFNARVREFAARVADEPAQRVVVVTHGGVIRTLICHFLGLDLRSYLLFEVKRASVSKLAIHDGRGVLTLLNDLHHLEGLGNG